MKRKKKKKRRWLQGSCISQAETGCKVEYNTAEISNTARVKPVINIYISYQIQSSAADLLYHFRQVTKSTLICLPSHAPGAQPWQHRAHPAQHAVTQDTARPSVPQPGALRKHHSGHTARWNRVTEEPLRAAP